MFYVCIYLFACSGLALIKKISESFKYVLSQIVLVTVTITLIVVELLFISTGFLDTYSERIGYGYSSVYDSRYETYYRLHKPREEYYIVRPEFKHLRVCNSLGFPDKEWETALDHKKRILFLGDSFTEGYGAPQDSSYVSILRTLIDTAQAELMNAGIAGNDPVVSYVTYRDMLYKFKPDIIVQTLSSNDMNTDIAVKGGIERFRADSAIVFSSRPWWEPIYAMSYVSRLFFKVAGFNELLLRTPFSNNFTLVLNKKAEIVFKQYAALAQKGNGQLVILLQPYQSELFKKKYEYDLTDVVRATGVSDSVVVIDLLPYYLNFFKGKEATIPTYYWKNDGHHNPKGYALMAMAVKQALDSVSK